MATPSRPEGRREFEDSPAQIETDRRDWILRAEDLSSFGDEPQRGDMIIDADNVTWLVGVAGTDNAYVPADAYGFDVRVQCARVPT